jgi:hypothetical protein
MRVDRPWLTGHDPRRPSPRLCEGGMNDALMPPYARSDPLLDLRGFVGLADMQRVESRWQSEKRKQPRRVKKERHLDDLSA